MSRKVKPPRYEVTPQPGGVFGVWDNGMGAYAVNGADKAGADKACSKLNTDEYRRASDKALVGLIRTLVR